jgi:hypothetical protein
VPAPQSALAGCPESVHTQTPSTVRAIRLPVHGPWPGITPSCLDWRWRRNTQIRAGAPSFTLQAQRPRSARFELDDAFNLARMRFHSCEDAFALRPSMLAELVVVNPCQQGARARWSQSQFPEAMGQEQDRGNHLNAIQTRLNAPRQAPLENQAEFGEGGWRAVRPTLMRTFGRTGAQRAARHLCKT